MKRPATIGIIYNSWVPEALEMAAAVMVKCTNEQTRGWLASAEDVELQTSHAEGTRLVITVGGDGTIIRAAGVCGPLGIPILGINMGRLGFMTELEVDEALDRLPQYLQGKTRAEERSMLQVDVNPANPQGHGDAHTNDGPYHALNDVVVARGAMARLVRIDACIDGAPLTQFRADAVMVATATGSTGYNLSVGGPILAPQGDDMILKAVAPHVGMAPALVLPSKSLVTLKVATARPVMLSVDGYRDRDLSSGDVVTVRSSPRKVQFLRAGRPNHFYETLTRRLGFGGGQSSTRAIQY